MALSNERALQKQNGDKHYGLYRKGNWQNWDDKNRLPLSANTMSFLTNRQFSKGKTTCLVFSRQLSQGQFGLKHPNCKSDSLTLSYEIVLSKWATTLNEDSKNSKQHIDLQWSGSIYLGADVQFNGNSKCKRKCLDSLSSKCKPLFFLLFLSEQIKAPTYQLNFSFSFPTSS